MNSDSKYKKKLIKLSLSEENSNRNSIGLRVTEATTTAGQQQQGVREFWIHHQTRDDSIVSGLSCRHCRPIT